MEGSLTTLLLSDTGITALAGQNVYWNTAPQSAMTGSWIVMNRITGLRDNHMTGPSGLVSSVVQLDCLANTYGGAKRLSRAVVSLASGYRAMVRGMAIQGIFARGERDDSDMAIGDTVIRFRTSLDLQIWHPET